MTESAVASPLKKPNLSFWLTDAEVCARLGVSVPTLDRYAKANRLHPAHDPDRRRGNRPIRVWDPDEVQSQVPAPPVRPLVPVRGPVPSVQSGAMPPREPEDADRVIARLVEMVVEGRRPPKPWIDLKEAAEDTGLSRGFLYRLIRKKKLDAVNDRKLKVRRVDVEDLDVDDELVKSPRRKRQ